MFAQEHRQKLEIQIVDAQVKAKKNGICGAVDENLESCQSCEAKIESDTKKLLRAEEVDLPDRQRFAHLQMAEIKELALLKSERQAQGRVGLGGNTIIPLLLLLLLLLAKGTF